MMNNCVEYQIKYCLELMYITKGVKYVTIQFDIFFGMNIQSFIYSCIV